MRLSESQRGQREKVADNKIKGITLHKFVITHKPIDWTIPFQHKLVTVNGYKEEGAIDASEFIGELNLNRTFAFFGGIGAILENIKDLPDDDYINVSSHRGYFGNEFNKNIRTAVPENIQNLPNNPNTLRKIITPAQLQSDWQSLLMTEFPKDYELVILRPINLTRSVTEQYATFHHLDDLLTGVSVAISAGILDQRIAAHALSSPVFIASFASKIKFFRELFEKVWWLAKEIYKKHYVQRQGYQERSINFMLERIVSIYLMQKVYVEEIPTICTNLVHIDNNMVYQSGA